MEGGGARNRSESRLGSSTSSFVKSLLTQTHRDNRHNLARSGPPSRALYYYVHDSATPSRERSRSGGRSGAADEVGWNDFPHQSMLDLFRSIVATSPRVPRRGVMIDGRACIVDLEPMLIVYSAGSIDDLSFRSVAWIDVEGRCFFPARHIVHGSLARRPLIENVSLLPPQHPLWRTLRQLPPRTALPDLNEQPPPPSPPDGPSRDLHDLLDGEDDRRDE